MAIKQYKLIYFFLINLFFIFFIILILNNIFTTCTVVVNNIIVYIIMLLQLITFAFLIFLVVDSRNIKSVQKWVDLVLIIITILVVINFLIILYVNSEISSSLISEIHEGKILGLKITKLVWTQQELMLVYQNFFQEKRLFLSNEVLAILISETKNPEDLSKKLYKLYFEFHEKKIFYDVRNITNYITTNYGNLIVGVTFGLSMLVVSLVGPAIFKMVYDSGDLEIYKMATADIASVVWSPENLPNIVNLACRDSVKLGELTQNNEACASKLLLSLSRLMWDHLKILDLLMDESSFECNGIGYFTRLHGRVLFRGLNVMSDSLVIYLRTTPNRY